MNKMQKIILKQKCIFYAANSGLTIVKLDDTTFIAECNDSVVNVTLEYLDSQAIQGHCVQDTLQHETNFCGEY